MIQIDLSKIIIDEKRQEQIIVFKETNGNRQFPIVIGLVEASSIKMKLANMKPPRPLTHDLLVSVIKSLDVKVERIVIDKVIKGTFHAKLELKTRGGRKKVVDTRPSDGVAIAVRTNSPIFVTEEVVEKMVLSQSN